MTVRIEIDLNARTHHNLVPAQRKDADGDMTAGDTVTVFESEDGVAGPAQVVCVDGDLVHLRVDWNQLRDDVECLASLSGSCLKENQSETACDREGAS